MLHLDTKNPNNIDSNTSFRSLLAFKPRQVLLAHHNPTKTMTASASIDGNSTKITSEFKGSLDEIILDYLNRNGFVKTLKRFKSEAQIQTDAWKTSSLHLEDMFSKHNPRDTDSKKSTSNKPVLGNDEAMEKEKNKKKKVIVESDDCAIKEQPEATDKKIKESSKNSGRISKEVIFDELETQPKKKKTKHDLVSSTDDAVKIDALTDKVKGKRKKNTEKIKLEASTTNGNELVTDFVEEEKRKKKKSSTDETETIQLDVTKKEKKSSKKRKRS